LAADAHAVVIRRGDIHLTSALCDAYLRDIGAVALLARDGAVLIVPLLKIRNARGDRVVHAQEFLRAQGVPELFEDRRYAVRWIADLSALAIEGLPELPS
jgi:hypothetical protein